MSEDNPELLPNFLDQELKNDELKEKQKQQEKEMEEAQEDAETQQQFAEAMSLQGLTAAYPEKQNVHTFLHNVATSIDTTKTGYLNEEELGVSAQTLRSSKELAVISDKIMGNDFFRNYFIAESEIITSTSLSRQAKLLELAIREKKEIADVTKPKVENKSWFKKKGNNNQQLD